MPDFYVEEITIEPYEYIRECSKSEIRDLIVELVDEGHLPSSVLKLVKTDKKGKGGISVLEQEFLEKMSALSEKFHTLSKEDEETLEGLFKKYN